MLSWFKRHLICLVGFLVLLFMCAFLLYAWFDGVVSLDYGRQAMEYQSRDIATLRHLVLEMGRRMSRSEIELLLTEQFGKDNIKNEGPDELAMLDGSGIVLKFKGDSLVEVISYNE